MRKILISGTLMGALMFSAAHAEPVKLKLSYFSSDRSHAYVASVKPFVDAVNAEGKGRIEIVPYFSGAITPDQVEQPDAVADGRADLAVIIPGYSPERFSDVGVLQLPELFRDAPEATYVFRRLADKDALSGFQDFVVIGVVVSPQEILNTRKKTASLADLKGQTIGVSARSLCCFR
jgi:TRAP-type transport system periplasmic protein